MVNIVPHEAFACSCTEGDVVLRQSYKPESYGKLYYPPKHFGCGFFTERDPTSSIDEFSWSFLCNTFNTSKLLFRSFNSSKLFFRTFNTSKLFFRIFKKCRVLKLQAWRGKISVLKATMNMHMHPEQHTVNSAALLHEDLNEMEKLDLETQQKDNLLSTPSLISSQPAWEVERSIGSKMAGKHTRSVLDDPGSGGPIEPKQKASKAIVENGETMMHNSGYAFVPIKLNQMASKILEHLESTIPKEKPSSSRLAGTTEKSATKLTSNLALGSMDKHQYKDLEVLDDDNQGNAPTTNAASTLALLVEPLQKKPAFQMSAHKDLEVLDDDNHIPFLEGSTSFLTGHEEEVSPLWIDYSTDMKKESGDTSKKEEDETIDTFTGKLTTLLNKAASLGHTIEDQTLVRKLLNAVPDRYLQIVASIKQYSDLCEMTLEEAIGSLKTYEERIKYKKGKQVDNQEKLMFTRHENKGKYFRGRGRGKHKFSQGRNHENFKEERKDGETSHNNYNRNNFKKSSYDTSKLQCYKCLIFKEFRYEIERLTRLGERDKANISKDSHVLRLKASTSGPLNKHSEKTKNFHVVILTPRAFEDDVALPVELAKARSCGRSAMYKMARAPYFRGPSTLRKKVF
nr:zinc finger, CCHC-type [Tanacetum cinerariifolium]